jgi:hypothetical protein
MLPRQSRGNDHVGKIIIAACRRIAALSMQQWPVRPRVVTSRPSGGTPADCFCTHGRQARLCGYAGRTFYPNAACTPHNEAAASAPGDHDHDPDPTVDDLLGSTATGDDAMHDSPGSILVTGATGGIGRAGCRRLAEGGATLLLAARDAGRLQSLCAELPARGAAEHSWISVDMTLDATNPITISQLGCAPRAASQGAAVVANPAGARVRSVSACASAKRLPR